MAAYELKYTAEEIDGILESVDKKTIYDDATQSAHGLMSTTDKGKVDAIPSDPKYTDTVYDDTALSGRVSTIEGKESGWDAKQETLVSGTNIKTVNGESLLGGGNIEIQGGGGEENVIEAITMNNAPVPVANKTASITETDPTVPSWAKQPNKPSYKYSEIGNTPDLSGFITKSVNDLTNYYLKSETYTKAEVAALIGAIQQFHYEIYPTLPASGESNVLYLIGPTGSGSDRYEEYVYANNAFTKIGDTSIDLSGYVTTSALNTALAGYVSSNDLATALTEYTKTSNLATVATSGSYNDLDDKPTIPDTSGFEASANKVSTIAGNETNTTKYPNTKAVADALGKWGVVSQTQTWSGTGTQPRTYVMSDLVYGTIPQANIDLFESAGATFNAATGYFELNGLTDISYEEMMKIYNKGEMLPPDGTTMFKFSGMDARTILPFKTLSSAGALGRYNLLSSFRNTSLEVLKFADFEMVGTTSSISYAFENSQKLRSIFPKLNMATNATPSTANAFKGCYSLENIKINTPVDVSFYQSPALTLDSVVYIVQNAANTSAITITLHADALARCTADTTEYTYNGNTYTGIVALANAKNITLASA